MKSVIAHAALLFLGAGLAWWAIDREPEIGREGSVELASLVESDLEEVRFTWPKGEVVVRPQGGGEPLRWAVDHVLEVEPPQAPKAAGDAGPAEGDTAEPEEAAPQAERRESRFPAGRFLERSLDQLTPLSARRSLGDLPKDRLASMGLEQPERTLVIKAKGKTHTLHLGENTFGDQARYARLEGRADVLLIDASALRGLEGTSARLMEGRLVPVELADIVAFEVRQGDKLATFEHHEREQAKKRFFAPAGSQDRSEEATGLIATLRGLRTREYAAESALEGASEILRVGLQVHEQPDLDVRLWRKGDDELFLQVGPWIGELSASRGKKLIDDVTAALPAE